MKSEYGISWLRVWLLSFLTFACFYSPIQNSNITTRVALTLSLLNRHETTIDRYGPFTIDKATDASHVYADKAPGISLLALPAAAAFTLFIKEPISPFKGDATSLETMLPKGEYNGAFALLVYLLTLSTVGALSATAAATLFRWCRRHKASIAGASFATIAYVVGTPLLIWSTVLFGHAAAGALLLVGFLLLSDCLADRCRRTDWVRALLSGFVLGLAFLVELTAGPAVALIAICSAADAIVRRFGWTRLVAVYAAAALGLAVPLSILAIYNAFAFGSPAHLGYASVQDFPGMRRGFFGLSAPSARAALSLLIGQWRGLLPLSPVLLLVPFGLVSCLRLRRWRLVAIVSFLVFCWYWLMNSGYYYWWGGYSTGPRHMMPSIALIVLPLAVLWDKSNGLVKWISLALLAGSSMQSVLLAAIDFASPEWIYRPMVEYWLPAMRSGNLERLTANAVGVSGYLGLIPVGVIWATIGFPLVRALWTSASADRSREQATVS